MVDEWGTWYDVEPGTNPGFLFQQNTMRDAMVAACNLNIFNNHCDRVRMANIAQVVNVLQAMILTKDDKMILTPTYWVFDLFKVHHEATMIPVKVSSSDYVYKDDKLPAVNCSASIDSTGKMHISLCNIDPVKQENIELSLECFRTDKITGKMLTAEKMNAHNTFDNPDEVKPVDFSDYRLAGNNLKVNMPPMSVIALELEGKVNLKRKEINLENPVHGVDYNYYKFDGISLPNFADLTPVSSSTESSFVIPSMVSDVNFALKFTGYIKIPEDGLYTFYTTSDDGSALLIDKKLVVNNDGQHAMVERSGTAVLNAGYHKIEILFFQAGGGMGLDVSIKGPNMEKQIIPAEILFREEK